MLIACVKQLKEENGRVKKLNVEECLKTEIVVKALEKNGSFISSAGNGAMDRDSTLRQSQAGVLDIWHRPDLLPI